MSTEQQTVVVDLVARTPKAFPVVLQALMDERGVSYRKLAALTHEHRQGGYSPGYLHQLAQGNLPTKDPVLIETAEVIARSLNENPDVFAEYVLAVARRNLDEREVGLARAWRNLRRDRN